MDFSDCPVVPAIISKISTNTAGGYKITLDIPEIAGEIVAALMSSTNRIVYSVAFADTGEAIEPRSPGRPKKHNGEDG